VGKKTKEIDDRITAEEFSKVEIGKSKVIDVRNTEYSAEHVEEAFSKPLASINDWIKDIDPKEPFFLHCAGGYQYDCCFDTSGSWFQKFQRRSGFNLLPKQNYLKLILYVKQRFYKYSSRIKNI
jgi:hypothetical protein